MSQPNIFGITMKFNLIESLYLDEHVTFKVSI